MHSKPIKTKSRLTALSTSFLSLGLGLTLLAGMPMTAVATESVRNNMDFGLKIQSLDTDWQSWALAPSLDWKARSAIVKRHEVRYASQLHQLAVSMVRQMPARASLLLKEQMSDNIACQTDIDRYAQGAEAHMANMDLEALYDLGVSTRSSLIASLHQGYMGSGELRIAMEQMIGRSLDQYDGELFGLIAEVNALDVHQMPEGQSRARLTRENTSLQLLQKKINQPDGQIDGWHQQMAEAALTGKLSVHDQLSISLLAEAYDAQSGGGSSSLEQVTGRYPFGADLYEQPGALTRLVDFSNLTLQYPLLSSIAGNEETSKNLHLLTRATDYASMVRSLVIPAMQSKGGAVADAQAVQNNRLEAECAAQIEIIMEQVADFSKLIDRSVMEEDYLDAQNVSMASQRTARRALYAQITDPEHHRWVSKKELERIRVQMLNSKLNELRNNGYLQVMLEGISGIPMNWVEPEFFETLMYYRPSDYREIHRLREQIEANPPSAQTAFYLDLIDQAVKDTMTEATRFGLTIAMAAYDLLIQDTASVSLTEALKKMRDGVGHQKVMHYAGYGFDALNNAELALASAYTSIFEDPTRRTWVNARDAITRMKDNTDEYGLAWNADDQMALPISSGERSTPRDTIFWCMDRAFTKTSLNGAPDGVSGLFMLYQQPRHVVTKMTGYKNSNPFTHIGRPVYGYYDSDELTLYYEGQMIRGVAFPVAGADAESAVLVANYEGLTPEEVDAEQARLMESLPEGAVMHVYAETMKPTVYTYTDLEGNLLYGFLFDGEAGYEWQRFTCRTDQR